MGLVLAGRRVLQRITRSDTFDLFIISTVVANTVTMSLKGYVEENDTMVLFNAIFTWIFIVELIIKVLALGPIGYLRDPMNDFDCLIVIISIMDMSLENMVNLQSFRTLRVLRVTKLLRSLEFMKVIISVLSSCLVNFLNILVLLCIFTFIFTLLGTKLFGGQFTDDQDFRQNWDTMENSFLNTF